MGVEPTSQKTSEFETDAYASSARAACNSLQKMSKIDQYPRPDSNRHARRQQILSLRCLPFHHVGKRSRDIIVASRQANHSAAAAWRAARELDLPNLREERRVTLWAASVDVART